jgi:hypothetical protein
LGDGIEGAYLTHTKDHKEYFPMPDALTLRRDVFTSNLPEREKTALARVLSRVGGSGGLVRARSSIAATPEILKDVVEAGIVGGAIGAFRAKIGPDAYVPYWKNADGTPVLSAPIEAVAAVVAFGAALWNPQARMAEEYRTAGKISLGILAARQMETWLGGAAAPTQPHGDFGGESVEAITQAASRANGFR